MLGVIPDYRMPQDLTVETCGIGEELPLRK